MKSRWGFWYWQRVTRADEQPYLLRLVVLRTPWLAVYLHWFLGSDDACWHDHPWRFASLVLAGGYWEDSDRGRRWYGPGSLLARPARWRHRVETDPARPAVTLVVTGPRLRAWGFWTPSGWIRWALYRFAEHCPE